MDHVILLLARNLQWLTIAFRIKSTLYLAHQTSRVTLGPPCRPFPPPLLSAPLTPATLASSDPRRPPRGLRVCCSLSVESSS